jgi:monofunctional biosynthetic peptidoglycan transglycosylase
MAFKRKFWLWGLSGLFLLGCFYAFFQVYMNIPDFTVLRHATEIEIVRKDKSKGTKRVGPKAPGWVPLSNISDGVTFAVVASEDTSYFSHEGVDVHELKEAIKKDIKERRFARGASTITQQVIKNVFLTREKTLWRKFREILWAREMNKLLTKSEVLAFYLNMVEWGPGIYGIAEASHHYFDASPSNLSPKQGAFLAMLLPSPRRYYESFKNKQLTKYAHGRIHKILRIMFRMKFITEPEWESAKEERIFDTAPVNAIAVEDDNEEPSQDNESPAEEDSNNDDVETDEAPENSATTEAPSDTATETDTDSE